MTKLTVAYGRVSSEEQAENQHAAEQQIARLIAAGVARSHIFLMFKAVKVTLVRGLDSL